MLYHVCHSLISKHWILNVMLLMWLSRCMVMWYLNFYANMNIQIGATIQLVMNTSQIFGTGVIMMPVASWRPGETQIVRQSFFVRKLLSKNAKIGAKTLILEKFRS